MNTATSAREFIVDVSRPTAAWRKALPRAAAQVRTMAVAALQYGLRTAPLKQRLGRNLKPRAGLEISVTLTGNAAVRRLNRIYRGKDKPTNVLSFPADAPLSDPVLLGDVVIAYGIAAAEARAEGKTMAAHLAHLVLHGVLHLLGYDHHDDQDSVVMERLESEIMAHMGFADPYISSLLAPGPRGRRRQARAAAPRASQPASKRRSKQRT